MSYTHGPGPDDDCDDNSPIVPSRSPNWIDQSQDVKKGSTHNKTKKHRHKESTSTHKSTKTRRHSSHGNKDSTRNSSKEHRRRHSTGSSNKDSTIKRGSAPDSHPPPNKSHRESSQKHRQSVPKSKMHKLQDDKRPRQSHKQQGTPEYYPRQVASPPRSSEKVKKNKGLSQSAPPIRVTGVPIPAPPRHEANTRRSTMAPPALRDEENQSPAHDGMEVSYPGAYYEDGGSEYSEESYEEDESLSDMENGEGLITAYVVRNEERYQAPPPEPRELVTRSAPPPPHQTMEAPHQVNETKQSLNITVPQGAATRASAPVTSYVQHSGGGKGGLICGAVTFAIIGAACVAVFFIIPLLGIWIIIPGIVFLIISCVFCCCMCSRSNTNVTTVVSNPQ